MSAHYLDRAVTPAVAAEQLRAYGRAHRVSSEPTGVDSLGEEERAFIAARDSFYFATVGESGWPYLQHRGGPPGFLRVLGPQQLAFADLRGNRQLISTGNLVTNDRASLFLMDYPQRSRLKIMGHVRVVPASASDFVLPEKVERSRIERIFFIEVVSFDWNCPKYITPRYTASEVEELVAPLHQRIAELEAQLKRSS